MTSSVVKASSIRMAAPTEKPLSVNPLEQFVLLAKSAKGAAAVELVKQALEAPGVYVFGELLAMPHIQELAEGPHAAYFNLLNLFAFGTVKDYEENKATLPELTNASLTKLRHLTLVALATKSKVIPYSTLLTELNMKNLRELEDLIIEVIYADIVRGKLDQKNQQLEVDYAIGRDIREEQVTEMVNVLQEWCDSCDIVLKGIDSQIMRANQKKEYNIKLVQQMETEIANIKKTLKTTQQTEADDNMAADSGVQPEKPAKKAASKTKGLRGSAKFWK
ncbi:COP9 signalosome complex subunit 7b-like [Lingula anatina]|nr:COP9 signalosome complex subunit 7b-like [Lingula anatina]|eukprot:XP_013407470.1 COP9 signalosome complex subunit 7b-like [Lingula anatina]